MLKSLKVRGPSWLALLLFATADAVGSINVAGPSSQSTPTGLGQPQPPLLYANVQAAAKGFDQVLVWEGLPHPFEKLYQAELAKPTHFTIAGEPFYNLPLALPAADSEMISTAVIGTRPNFLPWSGFKLCGGFHADYAVEWRKDGITLAQALICFTCKEARFVVGTRLENVDLSPQGTKALRTLLWAHHSQRPGMQGPDLTPPKLPPAQPADQVPEASANPTPPAMPAAPTPPVLH